MKDIDEILKLIAEKGIKLYDKRLMMAVLKNRIEKSRERRANRNNLSSHK